MSLLLEQSFDPRRHTKKHEGREEIWTRITRIFRIQKDLDTDYTDLQDSEGFGHGFQDLQDLALIELGL
ncbi:hypothetical protein GC175_32130 [bacterium]|nr:hypothetical protein [bacterium]